jgi:hypothetical protein
VVRTRPQGRDGPTRERDAFLETLDDREPPPKEALPHRVWPLREEAYAKWLAREFVRGSAAQLNSRLPLVTFRRTSVAGGAHHRDEDLGLPDLATAAVDQLHRLPGIVDEHALAGAMRLPHRRRQPTAFMGGVPAQVVPDNPKVGVTRANWYEPGLNRTYLDLATHYGTAILLARPRHPRDKAKVEVGVLVVERWILARLRNRRFFSLTELNQAIASWSPIPMRAPCDSWASAAAICCSNSTARR